MRHWHTFCHEIGRELLFKCLLLFKRVVHLAVWHGSRLKPAVKYLVHAPQHACACCIRDRQFVDEVPVQVGHLQPHAHQSLNATLACESMQERSGAPHTVACLLPSGNTRCLQSMCTRSLLRILAFEQNW